MGYKLLGHIYGQRTVSNIIIGAMDYEEEEKVDSSFIDDGLEDEDEKISESSVSD